MIFKGPIPFLRALRELARRKLVPTSLSSADLRTLSSEVRQQALFSARMTQLRPLQALRDGLVEMLSGKGNMADAKLKLAQVYQQMGYNAEAGGFPQDAADTVPPAVRGTLKDLASDKRMALTITTQYRMAANAAFVKKGMDEQRRYQWPALELVRIGKRRTPRGYQRRKGALLPKPGDDWASRFVAAGGELYDKGTRMIALKDSDVWQKLGDGVGGYKDTLGNPYSPFAYGSGWGLREVRRDEALLLGVLDADQAVTAKDSPMAIKADAKGLDPALLAAFKKDLVKREDGSVRLKRLMEAELKAAGAAYGGPRNRVARIMDVLANAGRSPLQRRCKLLSDRLEVAA